MRATHTPFYLKMFAFYRFTLNAEFRIRLYQGPWVIAKENRSERITVT